MQEEIVLERRADLGHSHALELLLGVEGLVVDTHLAADVGDLRISSAECRPKAICFGEHQDFFMGRSS